MDLVPKPDQVVAAAANVAHTLLYGGLADLRPMPRTLVDDGVLREVYHYRPAPDVAPVGDPVLLVTPLAAPALCYDLRRGCSLVEHLVGQGRPTYLVEYGEVSFKDRGLGLEHWVDEVVPAAVRAVSEHAGGRPVHLVGWSLGGIFALLAAADQPALPIASLTVLGTPVDVKQVPLVAPLRPLLDLDLGQGLVTRAYRALGGVPKPLVGWAFQLASVQKMVTKPLAIMAHLDDAEYLAQLEAVDRFASRMIAYPGRSFGQLYHRFVRGNALVHGSMSWARPSRRPDDLAVVDHGAGAGLRRRDRRHRAHAVGAGAASRCSPARARRPSRSCPAGTSGCSPAGRPATATWPVIDEWVDRWTAAAVVHPRRRSAREAGGREEGRRQEGEPRRRRRRRRRPEGRASPRSAPTRSAATARRRPARSAAEAAPASASLRASLRRCRTRACRGRSGSGTARGRWRRGRSARCRG